MTESILEEAQRLIHGPRNKNYGHPRENFADISALFSAYLERPITDLDVANLMILVKVARVKGTGYHRDSYTDIAGYAGCAERIYEEDPRIEIPIDLDSGVSSDWLFDECEEPEPVEEDGQLALFDLPLPDDLIRNENEDSLSWVDALNDITYSDGEDEDALVDLDEEEPVEDAELPVTPELTAKQWRLTDGSWELPGPVELPVDSMARPVHRGGRVSDYHDIHRSIETPQSGMSLHIDLDTVTYTSVTNAINALDDVYRSVRAELSLLAEKGTK
ncbi:phosphofructokinase [Mycobacterium phage Nhonho]|uniref:phosphofructokinase n=1 Tax=Mycobacterium phage Nhonho TaxID=1675553 RepID=UPI0006A2DDC0|nr:phosphofructokinase [Mycobacterium phage Nhonho]AKU45449.1 hypothetical protein NHONHO_53 [Mycobacterium phage Nhonho]